MKITADVERDILARSAEGWSATRIAEWLGKDRGIKITRQAVNIRLRALRAGGGKVSKGKPAKRAQSADPTRNKGKDSAPIAKSKQAEAQERILVYIRQGNTIETAARCAGIHRDTLYDWMKRARKDRDPKFIPFADAVDVALGQAEALNVAIVRAAATGSNGQNGAWQAAAWWLERRNRADYGRFEKREVVGKDDKPLFPPERLAQMSDEELAAVARGEVQKKPDDE